MNNQNTWQQYQTYTLPITTMDDFVIEYGQGLYLYDLDGNKLLDVNSGQFCCIFGHSNEYFASILNDVNHNLVHTSLSTYSIQVFEALKLLNQTMPELDPASIIFSTGSEALKFAQRYARHFCEKDIIVTNDYSFLALSLGSSRTNVQTIKTPRNQAEISIALNEFERIASQNNVAGFIIEPIISMGGIIFFDLEFFKGLRKICDQYNIILIFDESQSGFGRSGKWYYYQCLNVVPDIVISAKGLGNGYPISVVSVNKKFIDYNKPIKSNSTHQNAPFAGAIIKAGVNYIQEYDMLTSNQINGEYFLDSIKDLCDKNTCYTNPRGLGLMCAFDIDHKDAKDYAKKLSEHCLKHKLLINTTNQGKTVRFVPPYIITKEAIDETIKIISDFKY